MKYLLLILLLLTSGTVTQNSFSQGFHTSSNKALKIYNEGVSSYDFLDLDKAEISFKESVSIDKNFFEAYMMLGEIMTKKRKFAEAASYYQTAVRLDSLFFKPVFFSLAIAEMMSGDYIKSLIHFNVYLKQTGMSE